MIYTMRGTFKPKNVLIFSSILLTFLFVLSLAIMGDAADFCVASSSELYLVLTTTQSNGENDVIKIVQGTYSGNFVYAAHEAYNLTIKGGYTAGCSSREVDPSNTVLDGKDNGTVLVLSCDKEVNFSIEGITLKNGARLGSGGGLFVNIPGGTLTLTNNIITDNSTTGGHYGGGLYAYAYGATISLNNNTITDNSSNDCGGLHICGDRVTLANNTISHNLAKGEYGGGHGGGLCIDADSQLNLINNTITYNSAYVEGGLHIRSREGIAVLNNNITAHNEGGGLSASANGGTITLTNNTITDNYSTYGNYFGGGVHLLLGDSATVNIYNNIICNNIASKGNDLAIWNDNDGNYLPAEVNLFNNDFDQSSKGTFIDIPFPIDPSNLDNEDPLFVDSDNGDYRLRANSSCIDAGTNDAPELPNTDEDGNPRIVNKIVDIGAYEHQRIAGISAHIKVNGLDNPLTLSQSDTLTVTVALDNNGLTDNADWWLAADTPLGLYFFTFDRWTTNWSPAYQGPLFYLESFEVLNNTPLSGLPAGTYELYFGVDTVMDGNVTWDSVYYDTVVVNVTE